MISFLPLGGADEIGASCFYLNISGTGILLDCGIHPRKKGIKALPNFEILNELPLDFVLISHAHQDHIGSLPFLIQKFPHVIIYSTVQTKEIAEITLHNAINILQQNETGESDFKTYTHEETDLLVRSMREVNYNEFVWLSGIRHHSREEIRVSFKDAGHILGSAGILIEHAGKKLFYAGDVNVTDQAIMKGAGFSGIRNIDTLILETTYGSTDSSKLGTWQSEQLRFAKAANKILHEGGSVLVPVFALGKTQEMVAVVYNLMTEAKLTEANIYTGGIAKQISKLYDRNRFLVNRTDPDLELNVIEQIDLSEITDLNEFKKNPGIVLAASGMMIEGTTSFKLADYWLKQENFGIFIVGYIDEDTPGYKILNSKKGYEIEFGEFGHPQEVKCSIERFYFPSHSKREDLVGIVKQVNPKRVILVHGEHDSKDWVGYNILREYSHIKLNSAENLKSLIFE